MHYNNLKMQVATDDILNVTLLEPRQKHPTIFDRFDQLEPGESFAILNDHDPKPLYYHLLQERGNIFTWEYLDQGPEWWKVKISKRIPDDQMETLGQFVAKDIRNAQIFKKFGIDFCCGGKLTLEEACREKGLNISEVERELQQADKLPAYRPLPYNDWSLSFLADYIINTHHRYVVKNLPEIRNYAEKVMNVHGSRHPELGPIRRLVEEVYNELMTHTVKEEKVLFPYIKELETTAAGQQPMHAAHFGTVQNPINMMEMEHESVSQALAKIRNLSNNYSLPEDACASYSLLYRMLDEFEEDLILHIHLENNILFPKAVELEKKIL